MAIVITVLGIITTIAIWRMSPALERARVRRAASVLAGDLQYAQVLAARQRAPVVVITQSATQAYLIRNRAGTQIYRQRFIGPDTDYGLQTLTASPSTSIEVFPNGAATQTTTFTLGLAGYQRQVRLSRAGQVRLVTP